jgi:hypothetical protein
VCVLRPVEDGGKIPTVAERAVIGFGATPVKIIHCDRQRVAAKNIFVDLVANFGRQS